MKKVRASGLYPEAGILFNAKGSLLIANNENIYGNVRLIETEAATLNRKTAKTVKLGKVFKFEVNLLKPVQRFTVYLEAEKEQVGEIEEALTLNGRPPFELTEVKEYSKEDLKKLTSLFPVKYVGDVVNPEVCYLNLKGKNLKRKEVLNVFRLGADNANLPPEIIECKRKRKFYFNRPILL